MGANNADQDARLREQHDYISNALGFHIHPAIEKHLQGQQHQIRVADISPGIQFAESTQPDSARSFQRLGLEDVSKTATTAPEHLGQYDLVAVRLLHTSVPSDQWDTTFANLSSLLRPGGWLQWVDWDPQTARLAAIKPGASDMELRELFRRYSDYIKDQRLGTTYKISQSMRTLGLTELDSDIYPPNPEWKFTRNVAAGALDLLSSRGAISTEEANDVRAKVENEVVAGHPLLWYDLWCHVGQKPSK